MARKYQLKFAKGAPIDEHFLSFIDSMLSELNIPPATAQQMADKWQGYVGTRMAADAANTQRELDGLKTELGSSYDGALAAGQRGARALGLKGSDLDRLQGSIGAAPVVRLMVALGKRFDGAAPAAGSGRTGAAGSAILSALPSRRGPRSRSCPAPRTGRTSCSIPGLRATPRPRPAGISSMRPPGPRRSPRLSPRLHLRHRQGLPPTVKPRLRRRSTI